MLDFLKFYFQGNASSKPWPNGLASQRKFWTCIELVFRLAALCKSVRKFWFCKLTLTCVNLLVCLARALVSQFLNKIHAVSSLCFDRSCRQSILIIYRTVSRMFRDTGALIFCNFLMQKL